MILRSVMELCLVMKELLIRFIAVALLDPSVSWARPFGEGISIS